jgi:hypothetical protein
MERQKRHQKARFQLHTNANWLSNGDQKNHPLIFGNTLGGMWVVSTCQSAPLLLDLGGEPLSYDLRQFLLVFAEAMVCTCNFYHRY